MENENLVKTQTDAIESLEKLIAEFRAGKLMEFVGIAILPNGQYYNIGGSCEDRHTMAGMLLDAAIGRLTE